ncbi:MAG TPA: type IV pilus assembly protein PilM [Tepidisphaeraceae bacterium]|jgi:type IV pilus assembly protein PilM|nr:type IV pilus assembly protein PilM [Tepidisphaeraceae bacterium]
MASSAWGIDIGNRALKAIKLVRTGEGLKVDEFEIIEHETVLSNSGDNREALIQAAITNFTQRHQTKGIPVSISVSGQQSFARFIKLPPVEEKKIPEIVRFEAIQQIPFPLDDVEWSFQLFRDPANPEVEVGIFAMRRELVNSIIKNFTDHDLNVQVVQMSPLAVYNAMYADQRLAGTTMIIDMGAENTDLIIADGETVWLRSIPIGGNNFTETLVKAFKINFAKAEDLKRNASASKYARQIFQAMRPVFADLVAEIQRSIGFYASVHRESRIQKIIALGGTFRLPGLQKYLQQNLQLEVDRIDALSAGAPSDPKLAAAFNENLLSMVGAYGLAIQALGGAKIESSLLPQAIQRAKAWREKTKWFAAAAALFCVGTGIAYGSLWLRDTQSKSEAAVNDQQYINGVKSKATALDSQWSEIEQFGSAERQNITNITGLLDYHTLWPHLLVDIYNSVPTPQPELLSNNPDIIKKIPRDQRKQILLDSITTTRYVSDLNPILADPDFSKYGADNAAMPAPAVAGATPDPAAAAAAAAGPRRGFLITIVGTTPNAQGATFVYDTMVTNLLKITPKPNQKMLYAIAKAGVVYTTRVGDSQTRMAAMQAAANAAHAVGSAGPSFAPRGGDVGPEDGGGGGAGGFPGAPGVAAAPGQPNPYVDRITGEDIQNDREFKILLAVVLDPAVPPEAPATQPADASAAPATPAAETPGVAPAPSAAPTAPATTVPPAPAQ